MYHCHVHFYLIGYRHRAFEIIKEMDSLEHFTHEFWESEKAENVLLAKADVIFVNLADSDEIQTVQTILSGKNKNAELILLSDKKTEILTADLSQVTDIWTMPMSDEEVKFRFLRWQQTYKMSKDYWQTNQYFEATINHIPNLIWYKDKDGIHEKVNDSFCRTVNKTKQQIEGRTHAYIWDVEYDDPACIESEREVMTSQKTCVSEEEIQTGDGTRLLTTYKSPLYNLDGSVMGTVGVAIDVTQERAYEQELIQKNHTLETIFSTTDCGMLCHSIDGTRIISINQAALKILGYESQSQLLETGFDMIAPSVMDQDKERLRSCIRSLKKEGDSVSVEYRVQHDDGEILHIMGNIKLLRGTDGLFYQRFLLDCTTQKIQEKKEQMEKEKRQMELIQALGIDYNVICFFDLDTGMGSTLRMEDCNNHVLESVFSGVFFLDESIDRYIQACVYADDQKMVSETFSQAKLKKELAEKKIYYVNYRTLYDGEIKYFQMKAVHVGGEENQGVVIGFRNVDEEIRDEMEKKNMLEEALLQANKANKAKSTFLSNMSHDIRTPMNAIVGFTTLAIAHLDCQEQVGEYLEKIKTSGNHLLRLINDILDMSRIESGKIQLEEKPCSLPDILYGLHNILQADVHAKQLELNIDTVNVVNQDIYCDQLRLNQMLLNLLSNSIKYTNEGGSIGLIITEKPGAPAGYANYEFCVKDTGIGMSEEFVSHIFEPFERERNSTISRIQGTGLGMAITKNIVDMMNGSIHINSRQGVGTEIHVSFTFRLHSDGKKSRSIPELKNTRALIIAENPHICDNVTYMLKQLGMRPEHALLGEEAIHRTRQAVKRGNPYRTYIIDCSLPDMNGIEITRKIKKELAGNESIIIMTAHDWSNIREEAKEAGVQAFCSKPLFLPELRNCLDSIINNRDEETRRTLPASTAFQNGRILLAEDIVLNQEIAVAILGEAGFSVDIAENGQAAVDMLKNSAPGYYQLVLMDIQMPVMNGYEATKAIRNLENKELAAIPIFAMSANAFEEDRQEAIRCGMDGHIAKPIDIKALFDILRKVFI